MLAISRVWKLHGVEIVEKKTENFQKNDVVFGFVLNFFSSVAILSNKNLAK